MATRRRPLVIAGAAWALVLAAVLLVPLAIVVTAAFAPSESLGISSEQWVAGAGAGRAFRYVLSTYGTHLATSAEVALAAGALALLLGAPAGTALAMADGRPGARALEALLTLPLGVPGIAAAIALLSAFPGRGGALGLLVVGHVLYTLPYATRTVGETARASRLGPLLDAARTLGAGRVQRARFVLWPALRRAIGSAALVALAVSWGEFNVTFLLATPARGTFPTALYLSYTTNSFPVAAAATTIMLAGLVPLVVVALALGHRPEQGA
ncbi:MAG: ABC transporter permease subunit [Myxococcales bacterium]|nr:ABC transporter permease subunit [Myxococcales bacterium]